MTENKPFGFRMEILKELMKDPEYSKKLDNAKDWDEIIAVIEEFAKNKGYKVAQIFVADSNVTQKTKQNP
jgi:hypothetical protein